MDTYLATVISNEQVADNIFRIELQGDVVKEMNTPGQFVNIKVSNSYEFFIKKTNFNLMKLIKKKIHL